MKKSQGSLSKMFLTQATKEMFQVFHFETRKMTAFVHTKLDGILFWCFIAWKKYICKEVLCTQAPLTFWYRRSWSREDKQHSNLPFICPEEKEDPDQEQAIYNFCYFSRLCWFQISNRNEVQCSSCNIHRWEAPLLGKPQMLLGKPDLFTLVANSMTGSQATLWLHISCACQQCSVQRM